MKFNITNGDDQILTLTQEFAELYNNPEIKVQQIKKQLKLTKNPYEKLRKHCLEQGLIQLRGHNRKKPKTPQYYTHTIMHGLDYWLVNKHINGKRLYFGLFTSEKQAQKMVELCKECNWDISKRTELKQRVIDETN